MNTSTNCSDCREALRDLMSDTLLWRDREAMDEFFHSFADELATSNPQFDRVGFVRAATEGHTR